MLFSCFTTTETTMNNRKLQRSNCGDMVAIEKSQIHRHDNFICWQNCHACTTVHWGTCIQTRLHRHIKFSTVKYCAG